MSRYPTVREMGRLALPPGSVLAAGELGLERPVIWARTGSALSPLFPTLNADEAALLDFPLVQKSHPSLTPARMVRELSRLRVAAVVMKGEAQAVTVREAERTNLPLFIIPDGVELARVSRAIVRLIQERDAQEEAQANALYRLLSQQVAAEDGLAGLVQSLYALTGHAARVEAIEGGVLAASGTATTGAITRSAPIYVNEEVAALLTLSDVETRLDTFTTIALEQGAAALALELAKRETIAAVRAGVQGDFLTALLNGQPEHVLAARARAAEFPTDEIHRVVTAQCGSAAKLWMRRATGLAEAAGWAVRATVSQDGQATLVLSGGGAWGRTQSGFLEQLRTDWTEEVPLTIAVGDPAFGLVGLQKSLEEARGALALGTRLFGTGGTYVHRDMGVYRLLRHLQGTDDLKEFLERTLGALEAYDHEHQAELLPTLNVLLAQGGNVSASAKAMHLHRNSVIYRVERIREISGLDPTQAEEAFTLRLALMLAPLG